MPLISIGPLCAGTILVAALISGCAARQDIYVPPEALGSPSAQLSEALLSFAIKTQQEYLSKYRRNVRSDMLNIAVSNFLTGNSWSIKAFRENMPEPKVLLCFPSYEFKRIAAPIQNISGRANAIKSLLEPSTSEATKLFKNLGKNYSIDVTQVVVPDSFDEWLESDGKACTAAVADADSFATRDTLGKQAFVSAIASGLALFDVIWDIVKPALTESLKNVDLERRNAAVRRYFANESNLELLKGDVEQLEYFIKIEFELAKRKAAGTAVVAQAEAVGEDQYNAAIKVATEGDCRGHIARLVHNKTDPRGVSCLNRVYAVLGPKFAIALDAADNFDVNLEKRLPQGLLATQIDVLAEIAQGNNPPEDQVKALWGTLLRYASLFNSIKETMSDTNEERIRAAVDKLNTELE